MILNKASLPCPERRAFRHSKVTLST